MKSNFALVTILFIFLSPTLFAQHQFCGMSSEDCNMVKAEMLKNRKEMKDFVFPRNAVTYVPIRFFLVGDSDGSGRGTETSCLTALCNLNRAYEELEIQFYLKEFKKINNGNIYDNPLSSPGSNAISNQMEYNAINIFLVKDAPDPQDPNSNSSIAAFYQPPSSGPDKADWIVCTQQYISDIRVLAHEIGHFFTLPHTFHGWETNAWNLPDHQNPVIQFWAPDGGTRVELANGSNCGNAGDDFCDTAADYLFPSGNCSYNDGVMDKNGDLLTPPIDNYMNYHFGCAEYLFTEEQVAAIKNSLFSSVRNYIRPNYTPETAKITDVPVLVSPAHNEVLPYNEYVYLHWDPVAGADSYYLDVFSGGFIFKGIVESNTVLFKDELATNKPYWWKVFPFNEIDGCSQFSGTFKFKTGDGLNSLDEIEEVTSYEIMPNPVQSGTAIRLNVVADNNFAATISLISMTGQILTTIERYEFKTGNASLEISTDNIPAGVYFVNIQSESGILNKKVIVSY